jgi:antibiotic biosynthesis monooxygenase (ABM) superfamily enzyme
MICRIWRGWTTTENAPRYEAIVRQEVIPGIEAMHVPGFLSIDLIRRAAGEGTEFATIMWFTDLDAVKTFAGEDYDTAHVPPRAQEVLSRFDDRSAHYEVLERRQQPQAL